MQIKLRLHFNCVSLLKDLKIKYLNELLIFCQSKIIKIINNGMGAEIQIILQPTSFSKT